MKPFPYQAVLTFLTLAAGSAACDSDGDHVSMTGSGEEQVSGSSDLTGEDVTRTTEGQPAQPNAPTGVMEAMGADRNQSGMDTPPAADDTGSAGTGPISGSAGASAESIPDVNMDADASVPQLPENEIAAEMPVIPDPGEGDMAAITFTDIYENVLRQFCGASFCHGGGAAGFDVSTRAAAYESLVEQPANPERECADEGFLRVTPFEPQSSLLFLKLSVGKVPCGQQMPVGGELKQDNRDAIEAWISAGAPNN